MRLRDIVKWEPTGREFRDEFGVNAEITMDKGEPTGRMIGFSVLREYRMKVEFTAAIRCNDAEISSLQDGMERHLLHQIYGHIEIECHRAFGAISSGDRREAMAAVERIMEAITWKEGN